MEVDRSATIQSLTALEASIRQRTDTDSQFMNWWWLYILLLSWITFGIASFYYFVKRLSRVDKYSVRKLAYYAALTDFTDRYAQARHKGEGDAGIRDLRSAVERASGYSLRPIGALKAVLLTIVTFGIYGIFAWYQLNRAWADRQQAELEFDQLLSAAWIQLGITRYPITFEPASGKDRNFWLYVGLSIITFGIWGLVWDYKVHTDPDNIFPRIHQVEDTVVQLARAA